MEGKVEGGGDVVDAEGHACPGPEHHHGGLEAGCVVAAVVDDDLGYQLWQKSAFVALILLLWAGWKLRT